MKTYCGKEYRLNVGTPSNVTIDFLSSLLDVIRENDKKDNLKILSRIVRSFYMDKYQGIDNDIKELATELKTTLINNKSLA